MAITTKEFTLQISICNLRPKFSTLSLSLFQDKPSFLPCFPSNFYLEMPRLMLGISDSRGVYKGGGEPPFVWLAFRRILKQTKVSNGYSGFHNGCPHYMTHLGPLMVATCTDGNGCTFSVQEVLSCVFIGPLHYCQRMTIFSTFPHVQ